MGRTVRKRSSRFCAICFPIRRSSPCLRLCGSRWRGSSRGRRAPLARKIYGHLGGRSPILEETQRQARALEAALRTPELEARAFVAMRCWHPFSDGAAQAVRQFAPDRIVASAALSAIFHHHQCVVLSRIGTGLRAKPVLRRPRPASAAIPLIRVSSPPLAAKIRAAMENLTPGLSYRLLLSAHGLPKRVIAKGDPYQWQVEQTARGPCGSRWG